MSETYENEYIQMFESLDESDQIMFIEMMSILEQDSDDDLELDREYQTNLSQSIDELRKLSQSIDELPTV